MADVDSHLRAVRRVEEVMMSDSLFILRELISQVGKEIRENPKADWREVLDFVVEAYGDLPPGVYACLLQAFDLSVPWSRKSRRRS